MEQASRIDQSTIPAPREITSVRKTEGHVASIDSETGLVHLHIPYDTRIPPGATVWIQNENVLGSGKQTELEVVESKPGMANARPRSIGKAPKISRGDRIVYFE